MTSTIFALSSGALPSGIAVVRISGASADNALIELTKRPLPIARVATVARLADADGAELDRALVIWFPGPASVTGEDLVELHLHGGRAVVAAVLGVLGQLAGLRPAQPGEFTRRAFENNRIDLTEVEGLSALLAAETEAQRRSAIASARGGLGSLIATWQRALIELSADVEAAIDFSDEDDIGAHSLANRRLAIDQLRSSIGKKLRDPPAERLRDGLRIVIMGPPNAGKSTLFNALVAQQAAIVSPIAGTTRDAIEIAVDIAGLPLVFVDTAGLRGETDDPIEEIGIARAHEQGARADIILALGPLPRIENVAIIHVAAKADLGTLSSADIAVSALTGKGIAELEAEIIRVAKTLLPPPDLVALNQRHRHALAEAVEELDAAQSVDDELIVAEHLRLARLALGRVTGQGDVEDMLDVLFGTFCIGK